MKVLILSHNPMSTRTSIGKTLISLFDGFQKEELCQIYVHAGAPERELCSSCYRITDKSVLKGVFTRRVHGCEVAPSPLGEASPAAGRSSAKNHTPHRELLRDAVWKLAPWYNKKLRTWIREQKPTCIFAAIGSNTFLYDMALKIARDFSLPIFTYVCDDFYTMQAPRAPFGRLWRYLLRRKTDALMHASRAVVSICPEMSEEYAKLFGVPAHTVMTGTNFSIAEQPRTVDTVKTLRYFGKVSLNRYLSLAEIGKALDAVNAQNGTSYTLEIYCGGMSNEERTTLERYSSVRLCGFISGREFEQTFFSSDALIHIEAFDDASIDRVRHSVSTKIADSMASGIPMLAYGPQGVASIAHLVRNQSAFVATDADGLQTVLTALLTSKQKRLETAQNGLRCAAQCHDPQKASADIARILGRKEAVL